jgi:hypothetical protein
MITAVVFALNSTLTAWATGAVESQMMIEFQKKLNKKLDTIHQTTESMETTTHALNEEKKEIARELAQTSHREDKRYLLKKAVAVRVKSALNGAQGIVHMQNTIEEMIYDLEHLDRMKKNNGVNGVSADSVEHKTMAKDLMVGLGGLAKTVTGLDANSEEMIKIRERLALNDATFKSYFSKNEAISITKQIRFLEDHHSTLAAALKLLDREKENLRLAQYMISAGEIEESIGKINTDFVFSVYERIISGDDQIVEEIDMLNKSRNASRKRRFTGSSDQLGNY